MPPNRNITTTINRISSRSPMIVPPLGEKQGDFEPKTYPFPFALATTSPGHFFHGFLDLFDGLLGDLFDLADGLIGLALVAKFVIANQRAGRFLDSAFHLVCLAAHDRDSFCQRLLRILEKTEFSSVGYYF